LANLPERIQVEWPHHQLFGAELEVHGWRFIDGEVHLRVRLTDGSIGCLPASWTNVLEDGQGTASAVFVNLDALRNLRQLIDALGRRRTQRARRSRAAAQQ
jgi:hypothetical protein